MKPRERIQHFWVQWKDQPLHKPGTNRPNLRKIGPVIGVVILLGLIGVFLTLRASADSKIFIASGTIEATEVHLASELSGTVIRVNVKEGDQVEIDDTLLEVHPSSSIGTTAAQKERVTSPINGVVLERSIEPGEFAAAGSTLVTVSNLNDLTLTVYVPEDRYGRIFLGQSCSVTVDSYPNETFTGVVSHIADHAEFTPRNVQTADSRKTTVFAIRLIMTDSGARLKPGMPADVHFYLDQ
jgi:multidrug resistance efflux pump